jgi:hypothetical protein
MNHYPRPLPAAEKEQLIKIKALGDAFIAECNEIGQSREMALAKTSVEVAIMWAVKHVTTELPG